MEFFDVIFPVNIGPLTYRCSESTARLLKPGMMVGAPLKNRLAKGIVIGKSPTIPPGEIKDIYEIHGDEPLLGNGMMTLLKWMSEYYMAEQGLALRNMLPEEAFKKTKQRTRKILPAATFPKEKPPACNLNSLDLAKHDFNGLMKSLHEGIYNAFLLHAPSADFEYSLPATILQETGNAIVLAPEVSLAEGLFPAFLERFGDRVCLFHSELSKGSRSEAIERIRSGRSDIVLGTRSAVFAPLKKVSLIAVLHEQSGSYKEEKNPCYNARDVAVMRGFIEKATVLLSSVCPSIESLHNCTTGKYTLLRPENDGKRPGIKILDMRFEKKLKPYLAKTVIDAAAKHIHKDKKVMFIMNRRGYSTLLQCDDCAHTEECPQCKIPLIFHKKDLSLKCHYCGYALSPVPERCSRCKSFNLKMLGAGTQRVQEDLEELLGTRALRIDHDISSKKTELKSLAGKASEADGRVIIGTKLMTKRLVFSGKFSMAAVLNADLFLNIPDFRSPEKAYQEISSIIDMLDPGGEIFIQTRMPQNYLYRCLKNYDYLSFVKEENQRRKELNYPPYSRLLLIKFTSKRELSKELSDISGKIAGDIQILGPYAAKNKSGGNEFKLLLKSAVRGSLHAAAKIFLKAFKNVKDVKIRIDVDPITI